ncbi:MAG: hypothetical protein WCP81_05740 [Actinomycetes bacterium]
MDVEGLDTDGVDPLEQAVTVMDRATIPAAPHMIRRRPEPN